MEELRDRPNLEMALRVYGHQSPISEGQQDCEDTRLEVPFGSNNSGLIQSTLKRISARGTTPIARSLEKAAYDFPECDNCRNVIILITDGIEACDGDPCAVSRALQRRDVILKPFVIGIGLDDDLIDKFSCIGNYFDASDEDMFRNVLDIVITQALNNTTAQINLLNVNSKPKESNVAVTMYNAASGEMKYHIMHTLNHRGNPDTLTIDPLYTYDVEVHTIPPSFRDSVKLTPGIHNIIAVDAAQGDLELKMDGNSDRIPTIVRKHGSNETLHVQDFQTTERYRVGNYDLEVLTLPRTHIEDVRIDQSHTTTVSIPQPGALNISLSSPGYGSIHKRDGDKLEWVVRLGPNNTNQQFLLQPGDYQLIYRSKNSKQTIYTIKKDFTIESGSSTNLKL